MVSLAGTAVSTVVRALCPSVMVPWNEDEAQTNARTMGREMTQVGLRSGRKGGWRGPRVEEGDRRKYLRAN